MGFTQKKISAGLNEEITLTLKGDDVVGILAGEIMLEYDPVKIELKKMTSEIQNLKLKIQNNTVSFVVLGDSEEPRDELLSLKIRMKSEEEATIKIAANSHNKWY